MCVDALINSVWPYKSTASCVEFRTVLSGSHLFTVHKPTTMFSAVVLLVTLSTALAAPTATDVANNQVTAVTTN